jgi:hypothetical protein
MANTTKYMNKKMKEMQVELMELQEMKAEFDVMKQQFDALVKAFSGASLVKPEVSSKKGKPQANGYLMWCKDMRETVKTTLEAEANGEKVLQADVTKMLGASWQEQSDEVKNAYKERAKKEVEKKLNPETSDEEESEQPETPKKEEAEAKKKGRPTKKKE